ncbi:MAG TPA: protein-disulfide reductase DsbD family protein [Candidatus Kapabacteria bacterium]|nr:protein-disulfide reductase DsbD family protein [Candidatus Kapabacteria bacterium]HPO64249.1 protein-disulfide reductase DsbD family protein [Candidatus Kapabacteria bacterium]
MKYKIIYIAVILLISLSFSLKSSENVKVTAIFGTTEVQNNEAVSILFKFKIKEQWHIYWKNPGDFGLQTKITLSDTNFFKIVDIYFKTPIYFEDEDLISYGYSDSAFLLVTIMPLKPLKDIKYDKLKFDVSWLECKDRCLPGKQKIELSIKEAKANLTEYLKYFPSEQSDWQFSAELENEAISIRIIKPEWYKHKIPNVEFFPAELGYFENKGHKFKIINDNEALLEIPLDIYRENDPNEIKAVFKFSNLIDKDNIFNSIEKSIIIKK